MLLLALGLLAAIQLCGCGGDVSPGITQVGADAAAADGDAAVEKAVGCEGTQPTKMVQLPEGYSIDSTEVTRCQYKVWLDSKPSTTGQDPKCTWNTDYSPHSADFPTGCGWPPGDDDNGPLMCVDWCDAVAYCKDVGKRLCGKIGGGTNKVADRADASKSQWFNACSSGDKYEYPYGNTYDKGAKCNDSDRLNGVNDYSAGGSLQGCQSPDTDYAGVFDLSGNVWEWEDSCEEEQSPELGICQIRGGSIASPAVYASCGYDARGERRETGPGIGFRCCSE
jgi:formylglycine-generating enzyme